MLYRRVLSGANYITLCAPITCGVQLHTDAITCTFTPTPDQVEYVDPDACEGTDDADLITGLDLSRTLGERTSGDDRIDAKAAARRLLTTIALSM